MNIERIMIYLKKNINQSNQPGQWSLRTLRRFRVLDQTNPIVENFWSNRLSAVLVECWYWKKDTQNFISVFKICCDRTRIQNFLVIFICEWAEVFRYLTVVSLLEHIHIYLPINLSSPPPNQKYVSKWENRSMSEIHRTIIKNCSIKKWGDTIVFEEYLYTIIIAYYHNNIFIFHNL